MHAPTAGLTLGENIADPGGASVAYEAMERAWLGDLGEVKNAGGFHVRNSAFFCPLAQIWRINCREAERSVSSPWTIPTALASSVPSARLSTCVNFLATRLLSRKARPCGGLSNCAPKSGDPECQRAAPLRHPFHRH